MVTFLKQRTPQPSGHFLKSIGLAHMGDDIYDDPLLRKSLHHWEDNGKSTFLVPKPSSDRGCLV
jgi:hypothetical protein